MCFYSPLRRDPYLLIMFIMSYESGEFHVIFHKTDYFSLSINHAGM